MATTSKTIPENNKMETLQKQLRVSKTLQAKHEHTDSELTIAAQSPVISISTPETMPTPGTVFVIPEPADTQPEESDEEESKGTYTFSITWTSDEEREHERYVAIRNVMSRIVPRSDFVPWKYADWLQQRIAMLQMKREIIDKKVALAEALAGTTKIEPAFGGLGFKLQRGSVLGLLTIWCPWTEGVQRENAPWPGLQEMKWEGDDRARTGVSRFPPIPREAGNETVVWHQLKAITSYDFDQVRELRGIREAEVVLPEDEIPQLIGNDLWAAIEN